MGIACWQKVQIMFYQGRFEVIPLKLGKLSPELEFAF
jgi:hypothetical protein